MAVHVLDVNNFLRRLDKSIYCEKEDSDGHNRPVWFDQPADSQDQGDTAQDIMDVGNHNYGLRLRAILWIDRSFTILAKESTMFADKRLPGSRVTSSLSCRLNVSKSFHSWSLKS